MAGLATYTLERRHWYVMQAECGYVTKAFPTEQAAREAGGNLDEAFLNQSPVNSDQLAERVVDGQVPAGWRILRFCVGGVEFYDVIKDFEALWGTELRRRRHSVYKPFRYLEKAQAAVSAEAEAILEHGVTRVR